MIKRTPKGFTVMSSDGKKKLGGPYKTREEAVKRIQAVEYFKRKK